MKRLFKGVLSIILVRSESGRSSAWLERLLWEQEVARSNRVAPTLKQGSQFNRELRAFFRLSRSLALLRCATKDLT